MNFVLVFIGGGVGSLLRYFLSKILPSKIFSLGYFPLGTLCVNLLGSFVIGMIGYFLAQKFLSEEFRVFFVVGVLGGFTTFSSFGLESFELFRHGEYFKMFAYVVGSNIFGIALVCFGWQLSKILQNL